MDEDFDVDYQFSSFTHFIHKLIKHSVVNYICNCFLSLSLKLSLVFMRKKIVSYAT